MGATMEPHGPQIYMILNTNTLLYLTLVTQKGRQCQPHDQFGRPSLGQKSGQDPPRDQAGRQ